MTQKHIRGTLISYVSSKKLNVGPNRVMQENQLWVFAFRQRCSQYTVYTLLCYDFGDK